MRPESFNLPTFPIPGLPPLVCYVRIFPSSLCSNRRDPLQTKALLFQSARHMCVQRRAIPMLGRLKDYLYVPRSSSLGNCLLITKYRCRFFRPCRCMKSGDIHETSFCFLLSRLVLMYVLQSNERRLSSHDPALSLPKHLQLHGASQNRRTVDRAVHVLQVCLMSR